MRIGVISDSHGDTYAVKRAVELMGKVDFLIHLGDFYRDAEVVSKKLERDIIYIRGNCDFGSNVDSEKIIDIGSKRILITHGHKYNVKSDYKSLHYKASEEKADLVLFGHTHVAAVFQMDNIIYLNPGSVSRPRGGAETYGVITLDKGAITPCIIELY